jgi:hypothetical protein
MASIYRPYILFDTEQNIYTIAEAEPYIGFENTNDIPNGWRFDLKRWCSLFDLKLPTLPKLYEPSTQGLPEWEYFLSGVGLLDRDLKVKYLEVDFIDHEYSWTPQVDNGWYYRWRTEYFYYSDNSRVQYVNSSNNKDGRNVLVLEEEPANKYPISVASYTRDNSYNIPVRYFGVKQVGKFSGIWNNNIEANTYMPSTNIVIWDNVDINHKEFIIDRTVENVTKLLFNTDYIERVGNLPAVPTIHDFGTGDILGASTGEEWQIFYLRRFPVVPDTFSLYIVDADNGTWEEWTRLETYQDLLNQTGIPDPSSADNFYYLDKDLGIVVFADAESGIPSVNTYIVGMYDVTLRVEYEELNSNYNINAIDANTNPVAQPINQGYVCISHEELEAASITLKIEKELISFSNPSTYGPIYVGNDFAILRSEVLSKTGTPVPNVEVQFDMIPSNIGYIGGTSLGYSFGVTDGIGLAYSFYQPPVDADTMGFYATHPESVQGNILYLDNREAGLSLEDDIYLYKVLKDDPLLGMNFDGINSEGNNYLEANLPDPPWWADPNNGNITYEDNYKKWKEEMIQMFKISEWTLSPVPNGRKVVVYNWDDNALNPILGTDGAFIPTRPLSIDTNGGALTYPAGALVSFERYDTLIYPPYNDDVGSYWVCCTKYIEFQASCWSPYYNRIIKSNIIRAKVQLPRYLLGEYVNEQLQKVPFGWKIYQDKDHNHAAGLGGATFLTINPHSGPYQIIDCVRDYTTDEWSSYINDDYEGELAHHVAFKIDVIDV